MRIVAFMMVLLAAVVGSFGQGYGQLFAGFGSYGRLTSGMRDPRSNTGPVLFPPGPPANPADTSGVVVGASGYGFVPPNAGIFTYYY
ncbi:uncharacterized protein LOC105701384 [Orussus abietinus]|uniref:uncharacterized protein LOC105701384 n=1 Tax=Orussus abietinus TaxID=222816 RepID=UPI0006252C9F|nr:uncharacterized protein LOC105701384 [Orussus abietinus]